MLLLLLLLLLSLAICAVPLGSSLRLLLLQDSGAQPLVNENGSLALAVNGEIYNHRILRKTLDADYNYKTHSDCEVILPLVCVDCERISCAATSGKDYGIGILTELSI